MASINEEIAIRGPDLGFGQDFRHADQAGIGEIHGGIRIFIEKFPDCHSLLLEIERGADQSIPMPEGEGFAGGWDFPEQVHGFGNHCLAGDERWGKLFEAFHRPCVM